MLRKIKLIYFWSGSLLILGSLSLFIWTSIHVLLNLGILTVGIILYVKAYPDSEEIEPDAEKFIIRIQDKKIKTNWYFSMWFQAGKVALVV